MSSFNFLIFLFFFDMLEEIDKWAGLGWTDLCSSSGNSFVWWKSSNVAFGLFFDRLLKFGFMDIGFKCSFENFGLETQRISFIIESCPSILWKLVKTRHSFCILFNRGLQLYMCFLGLTYGNSLTNRRNLLALLMVCFFSFEKLHSWSLELELVALATN